MASEQRKRRDVQTDAEAANRGELDPLPAAEEGRSSGIDVPVEESSVERRKVFILYVLLTFAVLLLNFGHGSNIGVAISLPGESKAVNLAMGSWVMVGVSVGLTGTLWANKTFGSFNVLRICIVVDTLCILLMCWPNISLRQIYFFRFLVGLFEAPILPYLQQWLARYGKRSWNVWNTVLHAMVPVGENVGYLMTQEIVALGFSWQTAFLGQAVFLVLAVAACWIYGGRQHLEVWEESPTASEPGATPPSSSSESLQTAEASGGSEVQYPVTEQWMVYWATNVCLAMELGFLTGAKYVIRDYATNRGFDLQFTLFAFSATALCGPAIGGSVAMSGSLVRPDQWSQHRRTIAFMAVTSSVAALLVASLGIVPNALFWPVLFLAFVAAGGVYPAAQGIINIALTRSRVIEASVWQVQCNNLLFAMPMPYLLGKCMDFYGVDLTWYVVLLLQAIAAGGFIVALILVKTRGGSDVAVETDCSTTASS